MTPPRTLLRSEPDCSRSLDAFLQRLAKTVAWTIHHADPANPRACLRDPRHRPRTLESSYFQAVATVAHGPRAWPRAATKPVERSLAGGRLFVYYPDADLCDGAAEVESNGYLDVFNAPPWDSWVAFACDDAKPTDSYANYLIAYVPAVFLDACSAGIAANPEECIVWLEHADVAFRDLLRRFAPDLLWFD